MFRVLIIFLFITNAFATKLKPGHCPNVTAISVDLLKAFGTWYEYSRSSNKWNNLEKCGYIQLNKPKDCSSITIYNSISKEINEPLTMVTNFTVLNGKLDITYNLPVVGNMVRELTIVDIDYNDYVVGWLCINVGSNHTESVWVLTREQNPSKNYDELAKCALKSYGLKMPKMVRVDQKHCPHVSNSNSSGVKTC